MPPTKEPDKIVARSGQEAIDTALSTQDQGHGVTILIEVRGHSLTTLKNRLRGEGLGTLSKPGDETKSETTELLMSRDAKERRNAIAALLQEVFQLPGGAITVLIQD